MFSILMPIYNGIEFIDESVSSIINQTYDNWELLILINGHPKESDVYNIAKKYENEKIKVFDLYNFKGKSHTLNYSLRYCKYDKVCLLDVDDIWLPKKLEIQKEFIDKYDVIGTNCQYFGDIIGYPDIPFGNIDSNIFEYVNPIINSSSCFNKNDAYWVSEYDSVEDYDMWLRLMKENKSFYNIKDVLVYHRIHKLSVFNNSSKQKQLERVILKKYFN